MTLKNDVAKSTFFINPFRRDDYCDGGSEKLYTAPTRRRAAVYIVSTRKISAD
jgi:hypothetical protein